MKRKFSREFMLEEVLDSCFNEDDKVKVIKDEITDNGRWSIYHHLIFKYEDMSLDPYTHIVKY